MIDINIVKNLHGSNGNMDLNININIVKNDFIALSGQSGSGKTTLLRILAGLEDASGKIVVNNNIWLDTNTKLAIQKRDIGFVFQDYALFENMTVEENLLYVNKDKKLAKYLLSMTNLWELKTRLPHTLSGGQKQRVSLCRAYMNRPSIVLMDEPLSALDITMRKQLQDDILTLHKEFESTTIIVSHEPSEIYKLCNRVIVLNQGKIINDGTPKEVLLQTSGSSKFSFEGELLDIIKVDVIYIAIVSIGQQIVEVVVDNNEMANLKIGTKVRLSTKAFSPTIG
jgi:molybdate transport system ATP-binding protein